MRRIPLKDLPLDDDAALKQYLFDMYQRKDEMLKHFKNEGKFPGVEGKEIPLTDEAPVYVMRYAAVVFALFVMLVLWLM